jgi:hypothetical protein
MRRPGWWEAFSDEHPQIYDSLTAVAHDIKPYLPPINYVTLHYAYFISTSIVATLIFWGASTPTHSISWWDSMFMVVSAITGTGLNTVNVSQLTTFQQVELCVLMMMGSQVLISYFTVAFRKHIFEKRFEDIVERQREKRKKSSTKTGAVVGMAGAMFGLQVMSSFGKGRAQSKPQSSINVEDVASPTSPTARRLSLEEVSFPQSPESTNRLRSGNERGKQPQQHAMFLEPIRESKAPEERPQSAKARHSIYNTQLHSSAPTRRRPHTSESKIFEDFNVQMFVKEQSHNIGRNGQFFNLSSELREYLGGVEYRALKFPLRICYCLLHPLAGLWCHCPWCLDVCLCD